MLDYNGDSEEAQYFRKRDENFTKYHWNQKKIDALWQGTEEIQKEYGLDIDPRMLLAVIIAEGTGSFDTSSKNKAADGGNGAESDFDRDLAKASDLILGKMLGYIYYGDEFREAVNEYGNQLGIDDGGSFYQYCNWQTPIIRLNKGTVESGIYAGNNSWWSDVESIYNKRLGGDAAGYEEYLSSINKSVVEELAEELGIDLKQYKFYLYGENTIHSKLK